MAAGGNSDNIVVGPGRVYVAPLGTTEPSSCSAALPSAWVAVGYTDAGTTVSVNSTAAEIEVAEELDPVRYVNVKRTTTLSFAMAEATARNLYFAMAGGIGQANDGSIVEPPSSGSDVGVMIVWDREDTPTATNTRWLFRQCKPSGNLQMARAKSPNKTTIPVEINCEKPASAASWTAFPSSTGLI